MCLGSIAFLLLGLVIISVRNTDLMDVRSAYISAHCFVHGCDPYKQSDLMRVYFETGGTPPANAQITRYLFFETQNVYPPTMSAVMAPLALAPYKVARFLWITLVAAGYLIAAWLMWNAGSESSPLFPAALIAFYLFNSGSLLSTSNAGAFAISLCAIAAWCFIKDKSVPAGVLCMAVSLALKPHDSGLVWFYFLMIGGVYRKRALQSLLVLAIIAVPAFVWIQHISPHWISELHSNLISQIGEGNDPGPSTVLNRGTLVITDLQSVIAFFDDDPSVYNPVSYVLCLGMLAGVLFATRRQQLTPGRVWGGLAAMSALSMLPVYHRQYDAKLLLLTVPACAALWVAGGRIAKLSLAVEFACLFFTSDLPWALFISFVKHLDLPTTGPTRDALIMLLSFPLPMALVITCCFYTLVNFRRSDTANESHAVAKMTHAQDLNAG
jgi:hypothetical protein